MKCRLSRQSVETTVCAFSVLSCCIADFKTPFAIFYKNPDNVF